IFSEAATHWMQSPKRQDCAACIAREAPRALRGSGASRCAALAAGMTGVVLLLVLTFPTSGVEYPLRWRWSNPRPQRGHVVDMAYFASVGLAIQVAELGQIYSSVDLNFWMPRPSGTTNDLRAVALFPFSRRILITGANGTVLYADDISEFRAGTLTSGPTSD